MPFTNSNVLILDDTDATFSFLTNQSSPLNILVPANQTGTWYWAVVREGYSAQIGSFDATGGGARSITPTPSILEKPDGTQLYGNTTNALVTVDFDLSVPTCFIDIGDGQVEAQDVIDALENALVTENGARFLIKNTAKKCSLATLAGQTYLLLNDNYRIRKEQASHTNSAVNGFVISSQQQPQDGVNGPVQFLTAQGNVGKEVWDYLENENTVADTMKAMLEDIRHNSVYANKQTKRTTLGTQ